MEDKTHYLVVVKEAKTIRGSSIQRAEATCSKVIGEAAAQRISQALVFHREHGNYMQDFEEQVFGDESRSHHKFLSSCQVTLCHNPPPLRGTTTTSYHILLGEAPLPSLHIPPWKAPPTEEQPPAADPPTPMPKQSPRPKR